MRVSTGLRFLQGDTVLFFRRDCTCALGGKTLRVPTDVGYPPGVGRSRRNLQGSRLLNLATCARAGDFTFMLGKYQPYPDPFTFGFVDWPEPAILRIIVATILHSMIYFAELFAKITAILLPCTIKCRLIAITRENVSPIAYCTLASTTETANKPSLPLTFAAAFSDY